MCAMHAAGVVHGDLKPGNVHVDSKRGVCILDLESAILGWQDVPASVRARVVHTEAYAAPEVLAGQDCTPASDVYSLGVMLRDHVRAAAARVTASMMPRPRSRICVTFLSGVAALAGELEWSATGIGGLCRRY